MFEITDKDKIVKRLEKDNKKEIRKFLKTLKPDGFFFNIQQGMLSKAGISDTLGVYQGQFFAFETKSKVGVPTPLQRAFLRLVTYAGGIAGVTKTVADVKELLNLYQGEWLNIKGHGSLHPFLYEKLFLPSLCRYLVKIYLKFCTPKQALKILNRWNEKSRPPLPEEEIIESIINQS